MGVRSASANVRGPMISIATVGNRHARWMLSSAFFAFLFAPGLASADQQPQAGAATSAGSPVPGAKSDDTSKPAWSGDIETRNNLPPGALRQKLASDGVSQRTLIDQIRAQLAWSQILRDSVAERINVSDTDVQEQKKLVTQRVGQAEYRLGEIFIPVDNPANAADAQRFAETVINELHAGAPFAMVAAQFSQAQTALDGGQLGWVETNQLDPEVARLVTQMPVGAVSNPVRVPGGFSIVTLQAKREVGRDMANLATLQAIPNISLLIRAYFTITPERWAALAQACEAGTLPLVRGVVEDAAFEARFREIIAASQQAGPFPQRSGMRHFDKR